MVPSTIQWMESHRIQEFVVFHGSEGGGKAYHQLKAKTLAMHGYATLAYCYYPLSQQRL